MNIIVSWRKMLRIVIDMKQTEHKMTVALLVAITLVCVLQANAPFVKAAANIVVSLNGHHESVLSGYLIMGEITNVGDAPATNITVTIKGYDASNTFINSTVYDFLVDGPYTSFPGGYVAFVLFPTAKISFEDWIWDSQGGQNVDHCTSTVSFIDGANLPAELQITVTDAHVPSAGENSLSIHGTIKNLGTSAAPQVYVYGTCYDKNGAVIGSGVTSADIGSLDAGQTKSFGFDCTGGMASFVGIANSYMVTAESFTGDAYSGMPQYTSTSAVTGPIPEFSVICILLLLMTMSGFLVFQKKRHS
jgi:hypothetical protein